jgi:oxygen-dependent protoporphyrinogen oxidase
MTGSKDRSIVKRVAVIGGGISGLAAVYRLRELSIETGQSVDVQLYEANDRLGGTIHTIQQDGFLMEGGPDSFITQKPAGLALCRRLGIENELIQTNPECRRTLIVFKGQLHPIPEGFLMLAPTRLWPFVTSKLFSWPGKLRMGLDLILPRKHHGEEGDESLASFVRRRFGAEALERVAQPLVGGIYTADPEKLSLRTTMPRFLDLELKYRSLIRGMRAGIKMMKSTGGDAGARYSLFVSFPKGMTHLVDEIASRLPVGSVHTDAAVTHVTRDGEKWRIERDRAPAAVADAVILTCPAYASGEMVRHFDPLLADDLGSIEYASSATLSLAFNADQVTRQLDGFGFVVPDIEKRSLIAATFSSVKFAGRAPDGQVLMRAFLGGATAPEVYHMDDEALREAVLRDLQDLIGVQGEPVFTHLYRWPRSMPQYPVGHLDTIRRIHGQLARHPGLAVAGNAFGGIGIPDCIQSAEAAAKDIIESFQN